VRLPARPRWKCPSLSNLGFSADNSPKEASPTTEARKHRQFAARHVGWSKCRFLAYMVVPNESSFCKLPMVVPPNESSFCKLPMVFPPMNRNFPKAQTLNLPSRHLWTSQFWRLRTAAAHPASTKTCWSQARQSWCIPHSPSLLCGTHEQTAKIGFFSDSKSCFCVLTVADLSNQPIAAAPVAPLLYPTLNNVPGIVTSRAKHRTRANSCSIGANKGLIDSLEFL